MNEYIKLAWRNIWRNKRRTLITVASIFFAMFFALVMRSFQLGTYDHMIKNVVQSYTGYIQIQAHNYWGDKTIDNSFENNAQLLAKIHSVNNVAHAIPRLSSFALASAGIETKGAMVTGIIPDEENKATKLKDKLVKIRLTQESIDLIAKENIPEEIKSKLNELKDNSYSRISKLETDLEHGEAEDYSELIAKYAKFDNSYLTKNDNGVLIADNLAKFLKIEIGDTLVLISQGYHGVSAADKFPVRGILKFPSPELDKLMVYMTLETCQQFYGAENLLTSYSLNLNNTDYDAITKTIEALKKTIASDDYAIHGWKKLNKELVQMIESDSGSGLIMLGILYMIIGFGVFGTVLMMTAERKREFGVMIAVGMQKYKLAIIVTFEMIILGFLGIITGMIASVPVVIIGHYNPISLTGEVAKSIENFGMEATLPLAWFGDYYLYQALSISIIISIAVFYPIFKVSRIKVIDALKA